MVKTYLRYVLGGSYGVIASPTCNIAVDTAGATLFTGALESVGVWSVKRGIETSKLAPPGADEAAHSEVTRIAASPDGAHVAVGYADGTIRVFDPRAGCAVRVVLNGHKRAVSALAYDASGTLLVSGSRDTDVILWDVAAERGICRFRGHRDEVTDVVFLPRGAAADARVLVASSSKDTLIKVWDAAAAACVQTLVGARVEVWSLCVTPDGRRLLAGGGDNQLRVWSVRDDGAGDSGGRAVSVSVDPDEDMEADGAEAGGGGVLTALGAVTRQSSDRATTVRCSRDGGHVAVAGAGKLVEVYRRRSADEARRRVARRLKRHREKLARRRARDEAAAAAGAAAATAGGDDGSDDDDGDDGGGSGGGLRLLGVTLVDVDAALAALGAPTSGAGRAAHSRFVIATDEWELVAVAASPVRVTSMALLPPAPAAPHAPPQLGQLLLATQHNTIDVYTLPLTRDGAGAANTVTTSAGVVVPSAPLTRTFAQAGHRSDVRAVAVSADGTLLLSATAGSAKVWNARTGACVRTLDLGAAAAADGDGDGAAPAAPAAAAASTAVVGLCVAFLPGDRHALVGTKDGRLLLFNLASGDLLEEHAAAHEGPLWSMAVRPDGRGVATGGGSEVKFWDFQIKSADAAAAAGGPPQKKRRAGDGDAAQAPQQPAPGSASVPTLVHSRTLKLTDEVLCVTFSRAAEAEKLLVAVALVDANVKVFFDDTLKFFLSLYGHKLPVMAMDVSADSTLLVTASADKSVKLWGLDFGDCHRSFHAGADSVMAVAFVATTHYFFTASKDRLIKYWDGDRFEHILTLPGHRSEVWALAVARDGSFLASGGADRSLRVWRRTAEQVFLEEEREREFDDAVDGQIRDPDGDALLDGVDAVGALGADGVAITTDADGAAPTLATLRGGAPAPLLAAADGAGTVVVAHATRDTSRGGDRLLEALTLAAEESAAWREYAQDVAAARAAGDGDAVVEPPPRNPLLLGLTPSALVLRTLRAIRPSDLDQVLLVLPFADALRLLRVLCHLLRGGQAVELCGRAALLLLRVHHSQLVANETCRPLLAALTRVLHAAVGAHKDRVGFVLAGLRFLHGTLDAGAAGGADEAAAAPSAAGARGPSGAQRAGARGGRGGATSRATEGLRIGKRRDVRLL